MGQCRILPSFLLKPDTLSGLAKVFCYLNLVGHPSTSKTDSFLIRVELFNEGKINASSPGIREVCFLFHSNLRNR